MQGRSKQSILTRIQLTNDRDTCFEGAAIKISFIVEVSSITCSILPVSNTLSGYACTCSLY